MITLIKRALRSRYTPDFVYERWFERHAAQKLAAFKDKLSGKGGLLDHLPQDQLKHWTERINWVLEAPDNAAIPRIPDAGKLINDELVLHNGLRIDPLSYYSFPLLKMLIDNKGVHEPQEEKAFQEVLVSLKSQQRISEAPPVMLELGAYWSFYSMWFQQRFPQANCYMVEPNRKNLFYGKQNFRRNQMKGTFVQAGIGKCPNKKEGITTVDEICRKHKIKFLDILHSDIQGFELEMLKGSSRMLSEDRVGYVFISTHSNELHQNCLQHLTGNYDFELLATANLDESYSWDGILVLKARNYPGLKEIEIAKRAQL